MTAPALTHAPSSFYSGRPVAMARIFAIGGLISYRALFNWLHPSIFIPTMLIGPLFQILFFSYIGRYTGLKNDTFFVVGNSVQACAMAGIYATTMTIANERYFGTLAPLLASPANRVVLFLGRAVPPFVNGMVVSTFLFSAGALLLDFRLDVTAVPPLAAVMLVTVFSCTSLGMMLGSIGLRARDVFFLSNLVVYLMLLFCGANAPFDSLPNWMQIVGNALPLTHGIEAARSVVAGAALGDVGSLLVTEGTIGLAYALTGLGLFRFFEMESRRTGSMWAY
jgi:ABC-2 type transport system permease protein